MSQDFYEDLIYQGFFPSGKFAQPNFEVSKKALENHQKIAESSSNLIEMMLFYVETGSDFMNEFDGIDEEVCIDLEDTFEDALKKIVENNLQSDFEIRCQEIVRNANEGFGFLDSIQGNFDRYFNL